GQPQPGFVRWALRVLASGVGEGHGGGISWPTGEFVRRCPQACPLHRSDVKGLYWTVLGHSPNEKAHLRGLSGLYWSRPDSFLAERAGFEPAVRIHPHTLSRRAT